MSYQEIRDQLVNTRKDHLCVGCSHSYPKHTRMRSRAYKWNDEFHSEYLCEKCDEVLKNLNPADFDDGFMAGELKEWWREND